MGFFRVSTQEDMVKDRAPSNFITQSGIYEVVIKHVLYQKSQNGSETIDLVINYQGQDQTIWSAIRLTNNDGTANFENSLFNKLCIICGATDGSEVSDPVPIELPIGKNNELVECMEVQDLAAQPVYIRLQMEYSMYNEEIKMRKKVRNFFRITDKATAQEIVNNTDFGKQYAEEEKNATVDTYRDNLTKEDIDAWKKEKSENKKEDTPKSSGFTRTTFGRSA